MTLYWIRASSVDMISDVISWNWRTLCWLPSRKSARRKKSTNSSRKWGISMAKQDFPLIFERSKEGRTSYSLPDLDVEEIDLDEEFEDEYVRKDAPNLPEVSELEIMRHYTGLSNRNYGVDSGFYPLGSCTMKYNPKMNEDVARLPGFTHIHPYQDPKTVQGALEMMYDLEQALKEITGMYAASLQSA